MRAARCRGCTWACGEHGARARSWCTRDVGIPSRKPAGPHPRPLAMRRRARQSRIFTRASHRSGARAGASARRNLFGEFTSTMPTEVGLMAALTNMCVLTPRRLRPGLCRPPPADSKGHRTSRDGRRAMRRDPSYEAHDRVSPPNPSAPLPPGCTQLHASAQGHRHDADRGRSTHGPRYHVSAHAGIEGWAGCRAAHAAWLASLLGACAHASRSGRPRAPDGGHSHLTGVQCRCS